MKKCHRCGICCQRLPNWKEMKDMERAIIRQYDPRAELIFMRVEHGLCPNLIFVKGNKTECKIYKGRPRFCRAYGCWKEKK